LVALHVIQVRLRGVVAPIDAIDESVGGTTRS